MLMKGTAALSGDFPVSQLYLISGKEKQPMVAKLDYRKVLLLQKLIALKETGDTQFAVSGVYLEGPEVTAFWHEVLVRGNQSGDCFEAGQTVYVEPHAGKVAVQAHMEEAFSEDAVRSYKDLRERLVVAQASEHRCLILCPIQSDGPKHWTLLAAQRVGGEKFQVTYSDSLGQPSIAAQEQARRLFTLLYNLLGASKFENPEMPAPDTKVQQTDGWSCGSQLSLIQY